MNKSPAEIFAPERLSTRFKLYQKDASDRGRALFLSQMLSMLKAEFPEHKTDLDNAITRIRAASQSCDDFQQEMILRAMRSFATTVEEIAEDADLPREVVRKQLKLLETAGKVKKEDHPAGENYRDVLWFILCHHPNCRNPQHIHP